MQGFNLFDIETVRKNNELGFWVFAFVPATN